MMMAEAKKDQEQEREEEPSSLVEDFLSENESLLNEDVDHPLQVLAQLRPLVNELIRKNKKLEREVRQKNRLKVLGEMASCLAHEVRTPLSSVMLNLERLEEKVDDEGKEAELMDKVEGGLTRVQHIVDDILTYSREIDPIVVRFSWPEMIDQVIEQLEAPIEQHETNIQLDVNRDMPWIHGDHEKISRVHENVILNAIQATGSEGTVWVSASLMEDEGTGKVAQTIVRDDGPGISEEIQEKLFTPFHSQKTRGTGLGLAISDRIVRAHGGEIAGENRSEEGAKFTIRIPVEQS